MSSTSVLLLMAVAACTASEATPSSDVTVELASVTLADDCGRPAPPAVKLARVAPSTPSTPSAQAPAKCPAGGCAPSRSRCEQTSMQLSFKAAAGIKPTTIAIKRVELLDAKGKLLEVLTSKSPGRWTPEGAYVAWDESLAAGQTVASTYELDSPNWDKLTNGRWSAHSKTFQLRVTVTLGTASKTVEKQSITPARLAPPVPT